MFLCGNGRRCEHGLEEALDGLQWRQSVQGLNLANGSAGVELILFAVELSGLRIRELCLYERHLLSKVMSHCRMYHVPKGAEGWKGQNGLKKKESILKRLFNTSYV